MLRRQLIWQSKDGRRKSIRAMHTYHLANAKKVAERKLEEASLWRKPYWAFWLKVFTLELSHRAADVELDLKALFLAAEAGV